MNIRWYHVVIILIAARALTAGYRSFRKVEPGYLPPPETAALKEPGRPLQLELDAWPPAEPVGKAATDWVVGAWELYAISHTHAGPKIYDLSQGEGCAAEIRFNANGTWSGSWRSPGDRYAGSGTWVVHGDRYSLTGLPEPVTIFRQEKDLYEIVDDGQGNQAWLWYWPVASPLDIRDPIVGTWQLWRISDTYDGPKDPVRPGAGTTFRFDADGTWSLKGKFPGGGMTDSGTWTAHGERYMLIDPAGVHVPPVFREGDTLYQLMGESGGLRLYAWFRKQ